MAVALAGGGAGAAAVARVAAALPPFLDHMLLHFAGEEDHMNAVGKKYVPIALQKELLRRVWAATPAPTLQRLFAFVVHNVPRHQQRVRYVQAFTWAMPERAQQIGLMLYRSTDAVMWERLRTHLPLIIPRGVAGHTKLF